MLRSLVELHNGTIGDPAVDAALVRTLVRAYPGICSGSEPELRASKS